MSEKHTRREQRKMSIYFPERISDKIREEAKRLGRPVSWVMQRAWAIAREEIERIPGQ